MIKFHCCYVISCVYVHWPRLNVQSVMFHSFSGCCWQTVVSVSYFGLITGHSLITHHSLKLPTERKPRTAKFSKFSFDKQTDTGGRRSVHWAASRIWQLVSVSESLDCRWTECSSISLNGENLASKRKFSTSMRKISWVTERQVT